MKQIALLILLVSCGERHRESYDQYPVSTRCPFAEGQIVCHAASGERLVITHTGGGLSWDCGCSSGSNGQVYLQASSLVLCENVTR